MNDEDNDFCPYLDSGNVFLPHQCDEWFIGGRAAAEKMICDLQELLKDPGLKP